MKKTFLSALALLLVCVLLLVSCTSNVSQEVSNSSDVSTESSNDVSHESSNGTESTEANESSELSMDTTSAPDETDPSESSANTSSNSNESQNSQDEPEPSGGSESNSNTSSGSNETSSKDNPSKNPSESSNPTHLHIYNNFEVVEATCAKEGYAGYICECGEGQILERFPKVDHSMISGDVVNPTQTKRGEKILKCAYGCGKTETVELYSYEELGRLISEYALKYINQYRAEEGAPKLTVSKKITEYSEYRGQQALQGKEHRSHNSEDENLAAEATKYGKFFDFTYYNEDTGEPINPHWRPNGQEAWFGGTASSWVEVGDTSYTDFTGKIIADAFRGSSGHWAYVGGKSSTYKYHIYVGVGVSIENSGYVNCYVNVNTYNPDVMGYIRMTMDENGRFHEEWIKP